MDQPKMKIALLSGASSIHTIRWANGLADWHGYDRLIKAIGVLKVSHPDHLIKFTIVGAGSALQPLKELTNKLNLDDVISFTGLLYGNDLTKAFSGKNIAVSSLGLYRKGLNEASDLKTREYMARGLCLIGVGKDPDFPENSPYRFTIPNDTTIEPLADLLLYLYEKNYLIRVKCVSMQ